jgi:spermidine synthase
LFPWAGGKVTLGSIAVAYVALSPAGLGIPLRRKVAYGCALAGLAAIYLTAVPARLNLQRLPSGVRLISLREGSSDTVAVLENPDGHRVLRVNNRFSMGGTASANAERRHSHIPLLLHPAPRRALFLGVGTGISFAAMEAHPELQADGVELVPDVAAAMPSFSPHNQHGPRLRVVVADARRFVRATTNRYDVIVADLFHPARDGAGALYTREHFRALRARLRPGGLACQWLPLFQLDEPTLWMITRTWLEVFPETQAFLLRANVDTPVLGLVGWLDMPGYESGWLDRRITDSGLRERLRPLLLSDDLSLLGTWFADAESLNRLSEQAAVNTDDHPRVLFAAPRWNFRRSVPSYTLLRELLAKPRGAPDGLLGGAARSEEQGFRKRLRDFTESRDRYLTGLMADTEGQTALAEKAFLDSAKISPDFTSGYAQILARATQRAQVSPVEARGLLERLIEVRPERPVAREVLDRLGHP